MSLKVINLVYERFPGDAHELLLMHRLAWHGNDEGRSIYPSIRSLAAYVRRSPSQTRRTLHSLIAAGWVFVRGNERGGAHGATRQYELNLPKLLEYPSLEDLLKTTSAHRTSAGASRVHASRADATPTATTDGSHGRALTSSAHASQTVREPAIEPTAGERPSDARPPRDAKAKTTPEDILTPRVLAWAARKRHEDLERFVEPFSRYAKGRTYADIERAFMDFVTYGGYGLLGDWRQSTNGVGTMGAMLGVKPQEPGEPFEHFRARVFARADAH